MELSMVRALNEIMTHRKREEKEVLVREGGKGGNKKACEVLR